MGKVYLIIEVSYHAIDHIEAAFSTREAAEGYITWRNKSYPGYDYAHQIEEWELDQEYGNG